MKLIAYFFEYVYTNHIMIEFDEQALCCILCQILEKY